MTTVTKHSLTGTPSSIGGLSTDGGPISIYCEGPDSAFVLISDVAGDVVSSNLMTVKLVPGQLYESAELFEGSVSAVADGTNSVVHVTLS